MRVQQISRNYFVKDRHLAIQGPFHSRCLPLVGEAGQGHGLVLGS